MMRVKQKSKYPTGTGAIPAGRTNCYECCSSFSNCHTARWLLKNVRKNTHKQVDEQNRSKKLNHVHLFEIVKGEWLLVKADLLKNCNHHRDYPAGKHNIHIDQFPHLKRSFQLRWVRQIRRTSPKTIAQY